MPFRSASHPVSYQRLIDYAAGDLTAQGAAVVADHVARCTDCAFTLARFRSVGSILRSQDAELPPPGTLNRAVGLFPRKSRSDRAQPLWSLRFSFAGAALALFLCATLALGAGVMTEDAAPDSAFYPVRTAVQGLQLQFAGVLQDLGLAPGGDLPPGTGPLPTATPEVGGIGSQAPGPKGPPGQEKVAPGQQKTPPGQLDDPGKSNSPALQKTPPGQANPRPGQVSNPTATTTPVPTKTPQDKGNQPPGQAKTPARQGSPPGQGKP